MPAIISLFLKISLITIFPIIFSIVTYLVGSFQEKMNRLSWMIGFVATLGVVLSAMGGGFTIWTSLPLVLLAGLLNFLEFKENG